MYFGCDLSIEEYIKEFEKLGYTHEESVEFAKAAIQPVTFNMEEIEEEIERVADEFSKIGCTSFRLTSEEIERILNNESN